MKMRGVSRYRSIGLLVFCAVVPLLLSACLFGSQPAALSTQEPAITQPAAVVPPPTKAPAEQPAAQPTTPSSNFIIDLAGVAQTMAVETVAAKAQSADGPIWDAAPEHRVVTLQGYPVSEHLLEPKIYVYPAAELSKYNEGAGKIAADLQSLLQSQQAGKYLPYLPVYNAAQVLHAQVQYMNFKNGKGVRFLTQFDQAPIPINNHELIYTFQGLTSDGKYYVAVVLPVTNPGLPADDKVNDQQAAEMGDFPAYLDKTTAWLQAQPAESYQPDLAKLDALIQSIEVK